MATPIIQRSLRKFLEGGNASPLDAKGVWDIVDDVRDIIRVLSEGKGTAYVTELASTGNINIAVAPATIDGQAPTLSFVQFLKNQTVASQNGLYVWNGAGVPMTRATYYDTNGQILAGDLVEVLEGDTQADTLWELATDGTIIVGVTPLLYRRISAGAGANPQVAFIQSNGDDSKAVIGDPSNPFLTPNAAMAAAVLAGGAILFRIGLGTFNFTTNLSTNNNWSWELEDDLSSVLNYTGATIPIEITANNFSFKGGRLTNAIVGLANCYIHDTLGNKVTFKPADSVSVNGQSVYIANVVVGTFIEIDGARTSNFGSSLTAGGVSSFASVNIQGSDSSTASDGVVIGGNVNYYGKAITTAGFDAVLTNGGNFFGSTAASVKFTGNGGLFEGETQFIAFTGINASAIGSYSGLLTTVTNSGNNNRVDCAGAPPSITNSAGAGELIVEKMSCGNNTVNASFGTIKIMSSYTPGGTVFNVDGGKLILNDNVAGIINVSAGTLIVNDVLVTATQADCIEFTGGNVVINGGRLVPLGASSYGIHCPTAKNIVDYKCFSNGVLGGDGDFTMSQKRKILLTVTAADVITSVTINATLIEVNNPPVVRTQIQLAGDLAVAINASIEPVTAVDLLNGTLTVEADIAGTDFVESALNNLTEAVQRENNVGITPLIGGGIIISPNVI